MMGVMLDACILRCLWKKFCGVKIQIKSNWEYVHKVLTSFQHMTKLNLEFLSHFILPTESNS